MYKLIKHPITNEVSMIKRIEDNVFFPANAEASEDYQAYLKWLEEGNTPEPADGDVTPVVAAKTTTKA